MLAMLKKEYGLNDIEVTPDDETPIENLGKARARVRTV